MSVIVLVVSALVVLLYALIASIGRGEHFAPQAYYRSKRRGAPLAEGFDSLGPRRRRRLPQDAQDAEQSPRSAPHERLRSL